MADEENDQEQTCSRNYACRLEQVYCWPALPLGDSGFYFLGESKAADCPFRKSYGSCYTCGCPERREIYERYRS